MRKTKAINPVAKVKTPGDLIDKVRYMIGDIIVRHRQAGFAHGDVLPVIKQVPSGESRLPPGLRQKVTYESETRTIFVDFEVIIELRQVIRDAEESFRVNPMKAKQLAVIAMSIMDQSNRPVAPTGYLELEALIAYALGQDFIWVVARREFPDSWIFKKHEKHDENHLRFAASVVAGGIVEYLGRIIRPVSETISDDIWNRYNEDLALANDGNARLWFTTKGGYSLVAPILDHGEEGLRFLLSNPLPIDRHFELLKVPVYQRQALEKLAGPKAA